MQEIQYASREHQTQSAPKILSRSIPRPRTRPPHVADGAWCLRTHHDSSRPCGYLQARQYQIRLTQAYSLPAGPCEKNTHSPHWSPCRTPDLLNSQMLYPRSQEHRAYKEMETSSHRCRIYELPAPPRGSS